MTKSSPRWLLVCAALLPALGPAWLIIRDAVDVPYQDQWSAGIVAMMINAGHGRLSGADFLTQLGENRIVVPRLILFLLGRLTHWNTFAELTLVWLIGCASSYCVWRLVRKTAAIDGQTLLPWFLCNLFIFTLAGCQNWLWGMGLVQMLPSACLVAALVVILTAERLWLLTGCGMILCTVASFSSINGLLCWPLVVMAFTWSDAWRRLRRRRTILAVWAGAFLINLSIFLIGYTIPSQPGQQAPATASGAILYLLRVLGTPIASGTNLGGATLAGLAGFVMLTIFLMTIGYFATAWIRRGDDMLGRRMVVWLMLASFAVLSALVTTLFHLHQPPETALASQNCAFSIWLPVALINLVPAVAGDWRQRVAGSRTDFARPSARLSRQIPAFLGGALLFLHLIGIPDALTTARNSRIAHRQWKAALLLARVVPESPPLRAVVGDTFPQLRNQIAALDEMNLLRPAVIRSSNASLLRLAVTRTDASPGMIEAVQSESPGSVTLSGWAVLPDRVEPAHLVFLTYANELGEPMIFTVVTPSMERQDVVSTYRSDDVLRCGWTATISLARLPAGSKAVKIAAWAMDAEIPGAYLLQGERTIAR